MISCTQAVQQLWDYLENDVGGDDRTAIDDHLAFCRRCCGEVAFAEELRGVLADAAEVDLPRTVEQRLTGALDQIGTEPTGADAAVDTNQGGTP